MQGFIRSKIVLSLIVLAMIAISSTILFVGINKHNQVATPTPLPSGIVPTPTGPPPDPTPTFLPAKWTMQEGISYGIVPTDQHPKGETFELNLYTPDPTPSGKTPIVLFFHGCCNLKTTRVNALRLGHNPADPHEYMFRALLMNGYQVAALDYPIRYPHPELNSAEAGKAAVRFLRAHADQYHIDPTRFICWGSSGGGWPCTIMGTTDKSSKLDIGANLNYSSRVEAVLDWFGITDLQYITPDDAPFLIQQGDKDKSVPPVTSQDLYNALMKAGVFVQLQMVQDAKHMFVPLRGGTTNPDYAEIVQTAIIFLNAKVKNNPNPLPQ
jgi:acetyl esterase/lipase